MDEQIEKSDRLVEIDGEIEDAIRERERAEIDVLKATNESVIAFAKLGDESVEDVLRLEDNLDIQKSS